MDENPLFPFLDTNITGYNNSIEIAIKVYGNRD
jgi:hypothetical protein